MDQTLFMVEGYVAGITREQVVSGVARLKAAATEMGREGIEILHVGSTFVPSEGSIFSLVRGASRSDVEELSRRGRFPFHRITEAEFVE
ncbi:MAG TPA: hypothetical protein VF058_08905 [Actinomycetota bacterium]